MKFSVVKNWRPSSLSHLEIFPLVLDKIQDIAKTHSESDVKQKIVPKVKYFYLLCLPTVLPMLNTVRTTPGCIKDSVFSVLNIVGLVRLIKTVKPPDTCLSACSFFYYSLYR